MVSGLLVESPTGGARRPVAHLVKTGLFWQGELIISVGGRKFGPREKRRISPQIQGTNFRVFRLAPLAPWGKSPFTCTFKERKEKKKKKKEEEGEKKVSIIWLQNDERTSVSNIGSRTAAEYSAAPIGSGLQLASCLIAFRTHLELRRLGYSVWLPSSSKLFWSLAGP